MLFSKAPRSTCSAGELGVEDPEEEEKEEVCGSGWFWFPKIIGEELDYGVSGRKRKRKSVFV